MTTTTLDFSAQQTLNATLRAGCGATIIVTVTQGGAAVNLTGATIKYVASLTTPISKAIGSGITVTNEAGGVFQIAFTEANTSGVTAKTTVTHECKVKLSGEEPASLFEGELTVEPSNVSMS